MFKIFKKEIKRYEFTIVKSQDGGMINDKLRKMYNKGWELSGSASTHYHSAPTSAVYIYVPMKKLIVNKQLKTK